MHEFRSNDAGGDRGEAHDQHDGSSAALPLPAAGLPGDLTVLERLEAFRDLIRHGNMLLGEVVCYCRSAEEAVNQIAAEKCELDRMRSELEQARGRADAEAEAARRAMTQVEAQQAELAAIRAELMKARAAVERFEATQHQNAGALEQSLREAKQQQRQLEQELQRVRRQAVSSRALEERLTELDGMEAKLRGAEHELAETRQALETERSRRDRAIALIKPKAVTAEVRT